MVLPGQDNHKRLLSNQYNEDECDAVSALTLLPIIGHPKQLGQHSNNSSGASTITPSEIVVTHSVPLLPTDRSLINKNDKSTPMKNENIKQISPKLQGTVINPNISPTDNTHFTPLRGSPLQSHELKSSDSGNCNNNTPLRDKETEEMHDQTDIEHHKKENNTKKRDHLPNGQETFKKRRKSNVSELTASCSESNSLPQTQTQNLQINSASQLASHHDASKLNNTHEANISKIVTGNSNNQNLNLNSQETDPTRQLPTTSQQSSTLNLSHSNNSIVKTNTTGANNNHAVISAITTTASNIIQSVTQPPTGTTSNLVNQIPTSIMSNNNNNSVVQTSNSNNSNHAANITDNFHTILTSALKQNIVTSNPDDYKKQQETLQQMLQLCVDVVAENIQLKNGQIQQQSQLNLPALPGAISNQVNSNNSGPPVQVTAANSQLAQVTAPQIQTQITPSQTILPTSSQQQQQQQVQQSIHNVQNQIRKVQTSLLLQQQNLLNQVNSNNNIHNLVNNSNKISLPSSQSNLLNGNGNCLTNTNIVNKNVIQISNQVNGNSHNNNNISQPPNLKNLVINKSNNLNNLTNHTNNNNNNNTINNNQISNHQNSVQSNQDILNRNQAIVPTATGINNVNVNVTQPSALTYSTTKPLLKTTNLNNSNLNQVNGGNINSIHVANNLPVLNGSQVSHENK